MIYKRVASSKSPADIICDVLFVVETVVFNVHHNLWHVLVVVQSTILRFSVIKLYDLRVRSHLQVTLSARVAAGSAMKVNRF